jgi:septum formation inhibitor-activating ATPase MinD
MAARLTKRQTDNAREAIKTGLILKRLQDHALNENGDVMTTSQVQAARLLLGKVIPDLQAVAHTGSDGGPVQVSFNVRLAGD